ncbi:MAG: DNRLRE domain-containing protein [Lentisphaeria bacterium]|nr:DNRLRE domain-containing protein [Lentisphaeria bacterium]
MTLHENRNHKPTMTITQYTLSGAAAFILALSGTASAATVAVPVLQDHSIEERDGYFTTQTYMWIKRDNNHDRIGFMEFDLSAYAGVPITSASLSLQLDTDYLRDTPGNGMTLDLHAVHPDDYVSWDEDTLAGNTAYPAKLAGGGDTNNIMLDYTKLWMNSGTSEAPTPMASETITLGADTLYPTMYLDDPDLLSFLNTAKEFNGGLVTFMLWTSTENDDVWTGIATKENARGLAGPRLNITIPEPSTALLAGLGLAGLTLRRRRRK